jgi:hypothetical protein
MPFIFNKEKTQKTIAAVLEKMGTEADPHILEEYHNIFKKEVPLFDRTKTAAYLLMLCEQGKNLRFAARNNSSKRNSADENSGDGVQRYPLAEEESKRLFFSIGRSRRVYPREILGLINTKTAIPREDIGAIRILDNYSFVQVRETVAEKIIEALNGQIFRGRPLTVNYAKSRSEISAVQEYIPGIGPVGSMEIRRENDDCEDDDYSEQSENDSEEENI